MSKKLLSFCMVLLVLFIASGTVFAAGDAERESEYPDGPITVIVPYAAGGGMDLTARALATVAEDYLGVPLAVVNRTGGAGTIAVTEAARETPDGYTLLMTSSPTLTTAPWTQEVSYSVDDFDAVSGININDVILVTHTDSDYQSVSDLENAEERIRYGTVGQGGILHAVSSTFFREADIESTNVPFGSSQETITAVLGGNIEVGVAHPNQALTGINDGDLKAIGVFSDNRVESLPETPTMIEEGYDISLQVYNVLLVPDGVPEERLAFLRESFIGMLNDPAVQDNAKNRALVLWPEPGKDLESKLKNDYESMGEILKEIGILKD